MISVHMEFELDLQCVKSSLENQHQSLNNEIVLNYVRDNLLINSLNSATFIDKDTNRDGNKGFLNQLLAEFNERGFQ